MCTFYKTVKRVTRLGISIDNLVEFFPNFCQNRLYNGISKIGVGLFCLFQFED